MSYCRLNGKDSDVYMYLSDAGYECCWCSMDPGMIVLVGKKPEDAIAHLRRHVEMFGDRVPDRAFEELQKEIEELEVG